MVSPASASVLPGASQAFQASVQGTGAYSSAVNWSVNSTQGGSSAAGLITTAGVYTALASAPNPNTVTITATSSADTTKSGSSTVIVGKSAFDVTGVLLNPLSNSVKTGWTDQIAGTLVGTGTFDPTLTWAVNNVPGGNGTIGTIDNTGLYHAPSTVPQGGSVTVSAASLQFPNVSSSVQLTVVQDTTQAPVLTVLSPATADEGRNVRISGSGFLAGVTTTAFTITVYFTGPNGIQLPAPAFANAIDSDSQYTVIVPLGATDGPVTLVTQPTNGPAYTSSNTLAFTRAPRIRIRAPSRDLSSGESETFHLKQIAGTAPATVVWSATAGTVASDGTITAPSGITADTYVTVSACVQGTLYCDQQMLDIHPLRIIPQAPAVAPGQSIQLQAVQGNSILSPNWTLGGPGVLSASGLYTASAQFAGAGGIPLAATANNLTAATTVEVTGQYPGLVNRISDDYITPPGVSGQPYPYGFTQAQSVGIANNRLYVDTTYYQYQYTDPTSPTTQFATLHAVDVYDITDPIHPAWVDAFEPVVAGEFSNCGGYLYMTSPNQNFNSEEYPSGEIVAYDVSGASPVPTGFTTIGKGTYPVMSQSGCTVTVFPTISQGGFPGGIPSFPLNVYQMQNGMVTESSYNLPLPASAVNQGWILTSTTSDGKRLYLDLQDTSTTANAILTFDLTGASPTLLSLLQGDTSFVGVGFSLIGNSLFASNDLQMRVYDVSGSTPALTATLPGGYLVGWNGSAAVSERNGGGIIVLDLANPHSPAVRSSLYDVSGFVGNVVLNGNYAYESASGLAYQNAAGVAIWDVSEHGGLVPNVLEDWGGALAATSVAGDLSSAYLLSTDFGANEVLSRFDLTQTPPAQVWQDSQPNNVPTSLALSGTTLYEGTTTQLQVLDVSGSSTPATVTSISIPVAALAASGTSLLVGTGDNRLLVFDITNPKSPVQQGSLALPDLPYQVAISGNLALVADASGGLVICSIATPASPTVVSSVTSFPQVYGVAIDGTLALLAAREYGLAIVDISNPAAPHVLSHADVGEDLYLTTDFNKAYSVAFQNQVAYIGVFNMDSSEVADNGSAEIYGFDYSNPANPRLVSLIGDGQLSDGALALWTSPTTLLCACDSMAFSYDLTEPRNVVGVFPFPDNLQLVQDPGSIPPALRKRHGTFTTLWPPLSSPRKK